MAQEHYRAGGLCFDNNLFGASTTRSYYAVVRMPALRCNAVRHPQQGSPRYVALSWLWPSSIPLRMRTLLVRGHFTDELLEDCVGEGLVALGRNDKGARATDHVVREIALEIGFQRQDWQAVDDDAGAHRVVAGARGGPAPVVGAIAGNIDNAARP